MNRTGLALSLLLLAALVTVTWIWQRSPATRAELPAAREAVASDHQSAARPEALEPATDRLRVEPQIPLNRYELELKSVGGPLARFHGRVLYASTGQGVPWCEVLLKGAGRQAEKCTTDAEGAFVSRLELPLAKTSVQVIDSRWSDHYWIPEVNVQRASESTVWKTEVDLPPTLILDEFPNGLDVGSLTITIPRSLEDKARISLRRVADRWFLRDESLQSEPRIKEPDPAASRQFEELIAESRKHGLEEDARRLEEQRDRIALSDEHYRKILEARRYASLPLELRFENELWSGTASIPSLDGVIEITPAWRKFAGIDVVLEGDWSAPPAWDVQIELIPTARSEEPLQVFGTLNELVKKAPRFSRIEPGTYTLRARCSFCEEVVISVVAREGELVRAVVALDCATVAGSIRGEITSDSGEAVKEVDLDLWRSGTGAFAKPQIRPDASSARWKAAFEIKDVPPGEVQLTCSAGEFGIHPLHTVAARAGDVVSFRILDRPAYIDLGFRVFDADSNAELERFDIDLRGESRKEVASGAIVAEHVPVNGRVSWTLTSPGHLCAEGDLADNPAWTKIEGSKRWIDVRLRRGWRLHCVAQNTEGQPLAGARVLVDERETGTTDANGDFQLDLPERPRSIDVVYKDWICIERLMEPLEMLQSCDDALFLFERRR